MKLFLVLLLFPIAVLSQSIEADKIYSSTINGVKLFQQNNQQSVAILNLASSDVLELHFDDVDRNVKNYSYTYQLCNADWQPADLSTFDYIKGYQQQRFSVYRVSSIAQVNYVHYQTTLPDKNCMPTKSGNYLLKVFLNGDVNNIAFTKRLFVVNNLARIGGRVQQPFDFNLSNTHQKLQFSIDIAQVNAVNPQQQIKVVVSQNFKWNNALINVQPTFLRGNILEYNAEQDCVFPAGKEYRWVDNRSFRFESDRIAKIDKSIVPNVVTIRPDGSRNNQRYLFYRDFNGWFEIGSTETLNTWWQTDYANTLFTYIPANNEPIIGKEVYLVGELVQNKISEQSKMVFNEQKGVYEKSLFLKQGFYSYTYATKDVNKKNNDLDFSLTDGNYWETENDYCVLVYYRSYSGRHDELVGFTTINSRNGRLN